MQAAVADVWPEADLSVLLSSEVLECYTWAAYTPTADEVSIAPGMYQELESAPVMGEGLV